VARAPIGDPDGSGLAIAVVVSRFNERITDRLLEGCVRELRRLGVADGAVDVFRVPGAFELPQAAARCADAAGHDAVICLGAVIRGETSHYDHVADCASAGVAAVARAARIPVIFGVLTTEDEAQALARSGGERGHHGEYAARAAVEMARLLPRIDEAAATQRRRRPGVASDEG